jgi:hypothetical protein
MSRQARPISRYTIAEIAGLSSATAGKFLKGAHLSASSQARCERAFAELGGIYLKDPSAERADSRGLPQVRYL